MHTDPFGHCAMCVCLKSTSSSVILVVFSPRLSPDTTPNKEAHVFHALFFSSSKYEENLPIPSQETLSHLKILESEFLPGFFFEHSSLFGGSGGDSSTAPGVAYDVTPSKSHMEVVGEPKEMHTGIS